MNKILPDGNLKGSPLDHVMLVFHLRRARMKAREAGAAEAIALLHDLEPSIAKGGPLSEKAGVFWITVSRSNLETVRDRLPRLGYSDAVEWIADDRDPVQTSESAFGTVRWKGRFWFLVPLYTEDAEAARKRSPDRRSFTLLMRGGGVKKVQGYRGSSRPLERRALPWYDARILVNLLYTKPGHMILDPFAGAGGIVTEALTSELRVASADIDPAVARGLSDLGACHCVADARNLPLPAQSIDGIATEPPYARAPDDLVCSSFAELDRVLKPDRRIAMLIASWQRESIILSAKALNWQNYIDVPINRKGVDCVLLAWVKCLTCCAK